MSSSPSLVDEGSERPAGTAAAAAGTASSSANMNGSSKPFRLNLFKALDASHSSHGIAHQDYAQYQRHCSSKLHRLRRVDAVKSQLVYSSKYAPSASASASAENKQQGAAGGGGGTGSSKKAGGGGKQQRRHAFCPRVVPEAEDIDHENVLWTLLYQSERAWAQACALQQREAAGGGEGGGGGGGGPSLSLGSSSAGSAGKKSTHAYALRRLKKASKWASTLAERASGASGGCCVEETAMECRSYAAWMEGNVALERRDYVRAFESYRRSMKVLSELAQNVTSSSSSPTADALALGDVWTTRAETLIRPLVRFCGYEARDKIDPAELKEVTAAAAARQSGGGKLATAAAGDGDSSILLTFRGRQIALDSYKQLAVLYLKMETMLAQQDLDEGHFLQVLSDLDDALRMVQSELGRYESLPPGPAVTAKRDELQALSGYFQYQKLSVWRRQQEGRIHDLTEDAEIVHVYDTLQQNAEAMADLPSAVAGSGAAAGVGGGDGSHLEEDPFFLEAQSHVIRIRAFRCYHLARLYESALSGTPAQVAALLRQSEKLSKRAQEEIAACEDHMDGADAYLSALEELDGKIKTMRCRAEATKFLASSSAAAKGDGGGVGNRKTNRPLLLRMDDLDAGTSSVLADDPPLPIPMPCKPSFFDVAWQHVDVDINLEDIDAYINAREPTKKGFLSSWFG